MAPSVFNGELFTLVGGVYKSKNYIFLANFLKDVFVKKNEIE